jgi:hypothetical protein
MVARARNRTRLTLTLLLTCLVLATGARPGAKQAGDPIQSYLDQVSLTNLDSVATTLVTLYGPRRSDRFSPYLDANCTVSGTTYPQSTIEMASDYVRGLFEAMGYPPASVTMEQVPDGAGHNVYVTKIGSVYPDVFIEISGHLDSVDGSPGGSDNASGSTAVIELARVLRDYPNRYSMRFALWVGEEYDPTRDTAYYGSTHHVQQALARGEQIKAGLVMDHIGAADPSDPTGLMNEVSYFGAESERIADLFSQVRADYGIVIGFDKDQAVQNSDGHSYWDYGQTAVISGGGWPYYYDLDHHGCGDTVANINFTNVLRIAQQNLAVGLKLDAETVEGSETATALVSAPNPSLYAQAVVLTATVTATSGLPSGTVTFRDGGSALGTVSLNTNAVATLSTASLSVGSHSIVAEYGGDGYHSGSTSGTWLHIVDLTGSPVPTLATIVPSSAVAGGAPFVLTTSGTGFRPNSVVRWNGSDRATVFVSTTELRALISGADISSSGDALVTVFSPSPGGGTSNGLAFTVNALPPVVTLVAAYGFNEGTGTTTADASGNGNVATLGGPTWTSQGKFGRALSFDGTNDLVTVADAPSLDLSTAMTLEAWVYPASISGWRTVLMKEWNAAYYLYAAVSAGSVSGVPGTGVNISGWQEIYGSSSLPLNTWSHLAGTFDGATLRLYVNGQPVTSRALNGQVLTTANPLRVGGNTEWGEYFSGRIDEVRVYNRALSQAEIQSDMDTPVGGLAVPTLTALSPTSGGVGTAVTLSGTGLSGATAVRFNGTVQPAFTVVSDSEVTTTVPAGATSGPVQVVTPGGTATSAGSFTVVPVPTLTALSPTSGGVGTAVTLSGTGLSGATAVRFNGTVQPAFTVVSDSEVTTTVPAGATSGPVQVVTPGGTATSAGSFTVVPVPTISMNDVSLNEGDTGWVSATFTVALSSSTSQVVTVHYATADGTALAGSDYTASNGTLTFVPGVTSQTLIVPVLGDTLDETNETFNVQLSNAVNASIDDPLGVATINDNDPQPSLRIDDITATEGDTGTSIATFTLSLSAASGQTVTVNYTTSNGTAKAGSDYLPTSGTLTFLPGATQATIVVAIVGDTVRERTETFTMKLSRASNASIADGTGQCTILNDD